MKSKIGTALLALLVSFGLWLYVITVVSPGSEQTYYNIPVVFNGGSLLESRGLMMVSDPNVKVDLTLSGNRTDLNKLSSDNITILADMSGITAPGSYNIYYSVAYPGTASTGGITIVDQSVQQISVTVAERGEKPIPVEISYAGTQLPTDKNYIVEREVLGHESITVSGPKTVVDNLEKAVISVDLTGKREDFTGIYDIVLLDKAGNPVEQNALLTVSDSSVQASIKVSLLKTVNIRVQVLPGGGLSAEDITYQCDYSSIEVSGPEAIVENLNEIVVTLDLTKIAQSGLQTFPIELPVGVTNVSGVTQLTVDVELPELVERTFLIYSGNFVLTNIPEGMKVELRTVVREVTLRGTANRLAEVDSDDIQLVVDLAGTEAKYYPAYEATVVVLGVENVGAVGEYTVSLELKPTDSTQES